MDCQTLIVSIMADELINISKYNFLYICKEKRLILISHNPEVGGSSPSPATKEYITRTVTVLVIFYCLKIGCNNALK